MAENITINLEKSLNIACTKGLEPKNQINIDQITKEILEGEGSD